MFDLQILIPFGIAILIAVIVSGVYLYRGMKSHASNASEYKLFRSLLQEIDDSTKLANRLGRDYMTITNDVILANFETNLKMLENIVESAQKIRPYPADRYSIKSLLMLNRECRRRLQKSLKSFQNFAKGHPADTPSKPKFPKGCYFCSRPFDIVTFKIVRVKMEEEVKKPYACSVCRKQLVQKKKVKVLHFMHEGKAVHWSQMPGYKPEEHFFSLNNPFPEHKKPVLALVYSKKDGNNEQPSI